MQATAGGGTKRCPWCGETYEGIPANCPHCEEDLSGAAAGEIAAEIARLTREDAESGAFHHPPRQDFRRVRRVTIGWTAATLVLVGAGLTSDGALSFFGWFLGIIALIVALVMWGGDLTLLAPEKLTTPGAAFRTYLKCLREGRWEYARQLIAPRAREGMRTRPAFDEIKVPRGAFDISTVEGLRDFWKGLLRTGNGMTRTTKMEKVGTSHQGPEMAEGSCIVEITAYPSWIAWTILISLVITIILWAVMKKSRRLNLKMRLALVEGRWYLIEPVPALARGPEGA